MSVTKTLFAVCLLLLTAAHVESRRHGAHEQQRYKLFVFGDSFADSGNLDISDLSYESRSWYFPYGISYDDLPTGRFSNGLVQSDFLAKILGRDESPPPERLRGQDYEEDPFGMNFAIGWAGVNEGSEEVPSLGMQIDRFARFVKRGIINSDLTNSVALVAISGYDYSGLAHMNTDDDGFVSFVENVTEKIADGVRRIHELGVPKVLVNAMHPLGCTPWLARPTNYTFCDRHGNKATDLHNEHLKQKLVGHGKSVLLLDLNTMFTELVRPKIGSTLSKQFEHKSKPCCESIKESGYCGKSEDGDPQFQLCPHHERKRHFYWDSFHPTQAGWKVVMELLEGPIKDFLGISW